jgi:hypothetical protein
MYKQHPNHAVFNEPKSVLRLSDGSAIPFDPDNTDYQAFLKYQTEGGKVYGADEEVPNGQAAE